MLACKGYIGYVKKIPQVMSPVQATDPTRGTPDAPDGIPSVYKQFKS